MKAFPTALLFYLFGTLSNVGAQAIESLPRPSSSTMDKLRAGQFAVLHEPAMDVPSLVSLLREVCTANYGVLDQQIETAVASALARSDGHATYYRDMIETSANGGSVPIDYATATYYLSRIGSPEAIATLGAYLYDERNPGSGKRATSDDVAPPVPLSFHACQSMLLWLIRTGRVDATREGVNPAGITGQLAKRLAREWWASSAADEFRIPKVAEAVSAKTLVGESGGQSETGIATRTSTNTLPSPWVLAVIAAGLSAAVLLAVRKHLVRRK